MKIVNFVIISIIFCKITLSEIIINEVFPKGEQEDWIEFYVTTTDDYSNYKISQYDSKPLKIFPDGFILKENTYVVLHIKKDSEIKDEKPGQEGKYFDLYSNESGLISTDNVIILTNNNDEIIDAVIFADQKDGWTGSKTRYNRIINLNYWQIDETEEKSAVSTENITPKESIGRNEFSDDTNSKNDWKRYTFPTPGQPNVDNQKLNSISEINILPNPFIIEESCVEIAIILDIQSDIVMRIYDINGRLIKNLFTGKNLQCEQKIYWDGKDNNGKLVSIGAYICYIESISAIGRKIEKKIIVGAKKF